MTTPIRAAAPTADPTDTDFDAVVVGAGFAGLYSLHKLRNEQGLRVRVLEKGSGVGGTWFFNRYPGAKSDTESFVYRYSFDDDLLREYDWTTRYLEQEDILAYIHHVVERYDLMKDIRLDTEVTGAAWDESRDRWTVRTAAGEEFTCTYLVNGLGLLAKTNMPDIPGMDHFEGRLVHTNAWPEDLDVAGKRVGVIGTGSTGTQFIIAAAKTAENLTVFQRSPQYCVPSGNGPVDPAEVAETKKNFDAIWTQVRGSSVAFGFEESAIEAGSVTEEQRRQVFQQAWDRGNGFHFMFGTFSDIATNPEANEAAATFIRSKIAEIVEDPETARALTPTEPYAKRPLCNEGYYETFNRDNVSLVPVKENPIVRITPRGVRTADGVEHEVDILVFATGFDAVDGNYRAMDLRGRGGLHINEHWADAPTSYLGITTANFPNMFMILGPNGPFTNLLPSIETQVEYVAELIESAVARGRAVVEATSEAETGWTATCEEIAHMTLFPKTASWIFGANIPGKKRTVMFFLGGLGMYRQILADVRENGYRGLRITEPARAAVA
ncbi:NAD(P)/FAD-dependent oxidoreductase [uncultured Dietzia sp.]|jgi:cation diffusion facilitator CzcD-associated flavoprotein CzcO|uniref:flavin-containing monooxygenase n=1 Tax=uncultured Dietzia sp. TaxID=395519 RepID=UPI00261E737C|nr:NAD(P)/FAD-dependent oxidoreductase [uncultured Dietzia sp.]